MVTVAPPSAQRPPARKVDDPKRAILVLGPESSGTKLATRILIAAGCHGSDQHEQPLDQVLANTGPCNCQNPLIVWRRSFPHDGQLPYVQNLRVSLALHKYDHVQAVVMMREHKALIGSQIKMEHVTSEEQAIENIGTAYYRIFNGLRQEKIPSVILTFESLILAPQVTMNNLFAALSIPQPLPIRLPFVHNANRKHYV